MKAALDPTGDGQPDMVIVEHCCDDATRPAGECDYACGKTFEKAAGAWRLVDTSSPC